MDMDERNIYILKIADLFFKIDSYRDSYTLKRFENYMVDDLEGADAIEVSCVLTDKLIEEPQYTKLTDREEVNWYSPCEGQYTICFYDSNNDLICARVDYDNGARRADVTVYDVARLCGVDTEVFLCNVLERVFRLALIFNGGFVVHASSIIHDGFGLAFSAESGTGKSTHTGLWLTTYPGTYILNDDAPALRLIDGTWKIYGTPWAGTTGINVNASAPLKAIVFLERSENNTIRTCSALEGIKRLFEAMIHPVSDELVNTVLSSISSFISNSQMCVLGCNMTKEAPRTVKEYLY